MIEENEKENTSLIYMLPSLLLTKDSILKKIDCFNPLVFNGLHALSINK